MKKNIVRFFSIIFLLFSTLFVTNSHAQELSNPLNLLQQNVKDVTIKEAVYKQTFQEKNGSCIVSVKILSTDKQDEVEYEFNLSDLNEYKIELNASRQSLNIECETKGRKNVIRVYENGRIKKYTNNFEFYAKDVDNGKLIVEQLKKQVETCNENQNDLANILGNSPDLNLAIQYLKTNIKKVTVNEISVEQSFSVNDEFNALCSFDITHSEDSKNIKYIFNATDINLSSVDFETKNEFVFIQGQAKGNSKLIEVFENGEKENFTNKFEFYVEDIEAGRKIKNVLMYYVGESEKVKSGELAKLDNLNSLIELNDFFTSRLKDESINNVSYSQSFSYDAQNAYMFTFSVVNENKGDAESSLVNLVDLNENGVSFNSSGSGVKIKMKTNGGSNLVKNSQNGEFGKYTNEIELWSSGIEDARILVETLKKMILKANEIYEPSFVSGFVNPTKEQCLSFLTENFTNVVEGDNAFNLELKGEEENSCKLTYKEHDVTKDKTLEYKFDMNDINVYKISFNTRGKEATIYMETKGEKKYIEVFEQGTSEGYNNKIDLKVQDIEKARLISEAFKKLSNYCSDN